MTKFSDLKLDPKVMQAISEAGYENPTPIQADAIPPALEGRDVLGIAQTGTGKTASFTLPMITRLSRGRARARMPRSLVLCPTRELAAQVAENFDVYAKHTRLTKALLIGGVSFAEQDRLIDRGVDVLIATPGRLLDHFERGKLLLSGVEVMVVDEADRMLDMGFIPDIERIFQMTPFTRQTLFFSATMAPEIERITNTFLQAPVRVEVARQATTSATITQKLIELTPTRKDQTAKQKRELLRAVIDAEGKALKNAIIFCNRKTEVDVVAKSLKAHGFDAAPIHGDLDQSQRTRTLESFRDGSLRFLVASDVAARGLDIPAVSHVFNFDLPSHAEDYVHRIGRTGRAGLQGTAISLGTPSDDKYLAAIENLVKQALPRAPAPDSFSPTEGPSGAARRSGSGAAEGRRSRGPRSRAASAAGSEDQPDRNTASRSAEAGAGSAEPAATQSEAGTRDAGQQPAGRTGGREHAPAQRTRSSEQQGQNGAREADQRGEQRGRPERGADEGRGQDRRGGDRSRRDDRSRVVGMGDHVPDFMQQSFRPGIFEDSADESAVDAAEGAASESDGKAATDTASDSAPTAEAPAKPATRSRATSRRSPAKSKAAAEPEGENSGSGAEADAAGSNTSSGPADKGGSDAAASPRDGDPAATPAAEGAADADGERPPQDAAGTDAEKPAKKPARSRSRRKPVEKSDEASAGKAGEDASANAEGNAAGAAPEAGRDAAGGETAAAGGATTSAADAPENVGPDASSPAPQDPSGHGAGDAENGEAAAASRADSHGTPAS